MKIVNRAAVAAGALLALVVPTATSAAAVADVVTPQSATATFDQWFDSSGSTASWTLDKSAKASLRATCAGESVEAQRWHDIDWDLDQPVLVVTFLATVTPASAPCPGGVG